jgi:hypothetical protein
MPRVDDQRITEPKPTIKANLASMRDADPKSVEMRISGFGLVPAVYDPKTKLVEKLCQDLRVVTLPGQSWFQRFDYPLASTFSIISVPTGFWPTL